MRSLHFCIYAALSFLLASVASSQEVIHFVQPVDGSGSTGFLGLHNLEATSATVMLLATDDSGAVAPGGDISITLGGEESFYFSSSDLEDGVAAASGSFGDG